MEVAGGQNGAILAAATRRAHEVVREVTEGLQQAPGVNPALVTDHWTSQQEYGSGKLERSESLRTLTRDHVTHETTTNRQGEVVKHSLETYHEGLTEAGDHSLLLSWSQRHVPHVVSRLCGMLGALGVQFQPRDSVVYKRQADRWDGVQMSSHRTSEQVRVYDDGAVYHRSDEGGDVNVFLPGFKAD